MLGWAQRAPSQIGRLSELEVSTEQLLVNVDADMLELQCGFQYGSDTEVQRKIRAE